MRHCFPIALLCTTLCSFALAAESPTASFTFPPQSHQSDLTFRLVTCLHLLGDESLTAVNFDLFKP